MQYDRNFLYFNRHKIIYRRDPISDKPTQVFNWGEFYESGTRECYTLFNSKAKITTFKSLKWHLYVLWYLNPSMDAEEFGKLSTFMCDKSNGFVTFTPSAHIINNIVYEVSMSDLDRPPPNKLRKVIFKDSTGLTMREKLSIVGQLIGRKKISDSEIYDAMLLMHDNKKKVNITNLAKMLGCSTRTVHRNMGNELKKEKELLNKEL